MNNAAGGENGTLPARESAIAPLVSPLWQSLGVALATAAIAVLHWNNDGLWFQGDAPRHAANGLLVHDWVASLPSNPLSFALSYYARYPVVAPGAYPPLFYVFEAAAFGLFGPSPYVAKALVLAFAAMVGLYTMWWGRRWIGALAGWSGASVVLLPGFVRYSNVVLLNVPGTAFAVAALYHLHRWFDGANPRDARLFAGLSVAAVLTYYPAALVLPIGLVWTATYGRRALAPSLWLIPLLCLAAVLVSSAVLPVHFARQAPSVTRLLEPDHWLYYGRELVRIASTPWITLAIAGALAALLGQDRLRRRESMWLLSASVTALTCLVALPATSDRYALIICPFLVLSGFSAIATAADLARRWRPVTACVGVLLVLVFGARSAATATVPIVAGVDRVAAYVRERGPTDTVLYSGRHDGVFGFYVRSNDPGFDQRIVLSNKLLYRYAQTETFHWVETPHVSSPSDVAPLMQRLCGCQWVVVEIGGERDLTASEHILRSALHGPAFEHVASFPVTARDVSHIELYRFLPRSEPVNAVDLMFPSFSGHVFERIEPVQGR